MKAPRPSPYHYLVMVRFRMLGVVGIKRICVTASDADQAIDLALATCDFDAPGCAIERVYSCVELGQKKKEQKP